MIFYTAIDESAYRDRKNIHSAEHAAATELLRYAVKKEYGINALPEIYTGEKGKPYFKDSGIFFSISHAKGMAVCALSENEIGVDCEMNTRYSESAAKRIFSEEEKSVMRSLPEDEKRRFFTKVWTAKEAYGKALGTGILFSFGGISLADENEYGGFFIRSFEVGDYTVTAAAKELKDISESPVKIIL